MAQSEQSHRNGGLKLDTSNGNGGTSKENRRSTGGEADVALTRPLPRGDSEGSDITIKPAKKSLKVLKEPKEEVVEEAATSESSSDPAVEQYLRDRKPSVSFNNEVKLDTGHRQSMHEPLEKPAKARPRGRSLLQAISDERTRAARAHSESDSAQYDPVTGRHLPQYSTSPPQDHPIVGMGGFPLLQSTVDELARESQADLSKLPSMTSESTISPADDEVRSPQDDRTMFMNSSAVLSPHLYASSYEPPKRTASQRWRDGENSIDFFSRAGSLRSNPTGKSRRSSRRDTSGSGRSPQSAASSFLRAFSSHSLDEADRALECDAEGQTIGDDYVLGKQIGFGGFSVIKEVTKMSPITGRQTKLAVKIVRKNISGKTEEENEAAQAEFEHEVELWRHLNHPRILPLEAVYKTDEATFCFIPLNTGGTLFDLVRNNRQGLGTALSKRYAYQLASALRYLHCDARVAHRDIKLENVLIDTSSGKPGEVRLCDFGMAEWISSDDDEDGGSGGGMMGGDRPPQKNIGPADTSSSAFAGGSLEYAAPEILRINQIIEDGEMGDQAQRPVVSAAVDVWAFGVCVYCMVVGSRPFANAFQPRIVMAILANEWSKEKLRGKGGEECLELVEGCLQSEAERRWDVLDVLASSWLRDVVEREEREERAKEEDGDGGDQGGREGVDEDVGNTGWRL